MKTARDEMTRQVAVVLEEDDLAQAYLAMRALEIHHVPVVRDGKLVGILSDRDILIQARLKHGNIVIPNKKVGEIMSPRPISCHPTTNIGTVADIMLQHKIHCLPVIQGDETLVGILTSTDLIRLLRSKPSLSDDKIPYDWEKPEPLVKMAS